MQMVLTHGNFIAAIALAMAGLYIVFATHNLIKRMIGLVIFQSAAGLFYISLAKVTGGTAPIAVATGGETAQRLSAALPPGYVAQAGVDGVVYSNPLPHVLILTAIVVGVSTLSVGLAIVVRIREAYGTVERDEIEAADRARLGDPA